MGFQDLPIPQIGFGQLAFEDGLGLLAFGLWLSGLRALAGPGVFGFRVRGRG